MKKFLLISAATLFCISGAASASALIDLDALQLKNAGGYMQLAKKGSDDGAGHDAGDDHGGSNGNSGGGGNNSDDDESGSNRSKPRVPGGSGCDDAGDVAEHSGCAG
jgi:hypothetical protein